MYVIAAFKEFIQNSIPKRRLGRLVFEMTRSAMAPAIGRRHVSYGLEQPADYSKIFTYLKEEIRIWRSIKGGQKMGDMVLNVPGRHNVLNAWRRRPLPPMPATAF